MSYRNQQRSKAPVAYEQPPQLETPQFGTPKLGDTPPDGWLVQGLNTLSQIPVLGPLFNNDVTRGIAGAIDRVGTAYNTLTDPNALHSTPQQTQDYDYSFLTSGEVKALAQEFAAAGGNMSAFNHWIAQHNAGSLPPQQIYDDVAKQQAKQSALNDIGTNRANTLGDYTNQLGEFSGMLKDPNRMLTNAEYGTQYSANKAAYDNLLRQGQQNEREQQAAHTGGALTGRGMQMHTMYDQLGSQAFANSIAPLMANIRSRYDTTTENRNRAADYYDQQKASVNAGYMPNYMGAYETGVALNNAVSGNAQQAAGNTMNFVGSGLSLGRDALDTGATFAGQFAPKVSGMFKGKR